MMMMQAAESVYSVETLSKVGGMKFSRNNGRNSKNIQRFPRVPFDVQRKLPARQVPPVRVRIKCPSAEAAASLVVTLTLVPETRTQESAWFEHECKSGTKECGVAPVYLGTSEKVEGNCAIVAFHPKKVWRYNHAMKKNLGRRRELHCIQYSVFQGDCCVYTTFGPTFELENKKREQSSRKRRLNAAKEAAEAAAKAAKEAAAAAAAATHAATHAAATHAPPASHAFVPGAPTSVGPGHGVGGHDDEHAHPRANKRRREIEECMALDNTLATIYLADAPATARLFEDPDLLFLRKANRAAHRAAGDNTAARRASASSDDSLLSGSELMHAFDDDEDDNDGDKKRDGDQKDEGEGGAAGSDDQCQCASHHKYDTHTAHRESKPAAPDDEAKHSNDTAQRRRRRPRTKERPEAPPVSRRRSRTTPGAGSVGGSESDVSDAVGASYGSDDRLQPRGGHAVMVAGGSDADSFTLGDDVSSAGDDGADSGDALVSADDIEMSLAGGDSDDVVLHDAPLRRAQRVNLPRHGRRRSRSRSRSRSRTRRRQQLATPAPGAEADAAALMTEFGPLEALAEDELPPMCASPTMHVGSDGLAQFTVADSGSSVALACIAAVPLDATQLADDYMPAPHSSRRPSRSSRRSRRSRGRASRGGASKKAGKRRASRSLRGGAHAGDDDDSDSYDDHDDNLRLVPGDMQVPLSMELDSDSDGAGVGADGAAVAQGCSGRAFLVTSLAVMFLAAVVVVAAVLVFQSGGHHSHSSGANNVVDPTSSCVVTAWSPWSDCCRHERIRTRDVISGDPLACGLAMRQVAHCSTESPTCHTNLPPPPASHFHPPLHAPRRRALRAQ